MNCSAQRSFKEPVERGHRPAAWMRELPTSVFLQIRQAPRLLAVSASPHVSQLTDRALARSIPQSGSHRRLKRDLFARPRDNDAKKL
jgi:hypothetical protein